MYLLYNMLNLVKILAHAGIYYAVRGGMLAVMPQNRCRLAAT